jgi:acetylglutamate kinase
MTALRVIKIGGNVIDNDALLQHVLDDLASIAEPFILVHGGGAIATELNTRLGIPTTMVDGRRITDAETLRTVTMVYAGLINKSLVASLQARACNAIGLCGADANIVLATKRGTVERDYGFVGDVVNVNADALLAQLQHVRCVVVAPITHDGRGQLLNTNADTMAAEIAAALCAHTSVELTYVFDHRGVMRSIDDPASVIAELALADIEPLTASGIISKGMVPKIHNAVRAAAAGAQVRICGPADIHTNAGTRIRTDHA